MIKINFPNNRADLCGTIINRSSPKTTALLERLLLRIFETK